MKHREIYLNAPAGASPEVLKAYLDKACGDDSELRARVEALIEANVEPGSLITPSRLAEKPTITDDSPGAEGVGDAIGSYKLLERIGEGGMGTVYMAQQEKPVKRKVALKIIKLGMDSKQVVARFEAERQALAMMDNPNIARLLDAGVTDTGRPYFVMDLVRGVSITRFCDEKRLFLKERLNLFIPVCHAIQHAHQKGVIHRDIKPSNILVTMNAGRPHPVVIDFGVAKATNQRLTEKTLFTQFAQIIGTPAYMSPEQAEMSIQDVDTRSDVYSLGVLLYELLTGTTPFPPERLHSAGYAEMQRIIKEEEPLRPSTMMSRMDNARKSVSANRGLDEAGLVRSCKGDLDWIVLKALEKDRERRYESAGGLAMEVQRHLNDEPITARPPTFIYQLQKGWKRNRIVYSAAAMVLASLLVGISLSVWQAMVAIEARKDAEDANAREVALRKEAVERGRRQRLISYSSDMQAANNYLNENNLAQVERLLARYAPKPGETDIRGIFWYHLNDAISANNGAIETLPHETMVRSLTLSADGTRLASQTMSGRVRLYDLRLAADPRAPGSPAVEPTLVHEFGGGYMSHGAQDGSVALSPNGQLLAADQQGTLKVWNAVSGELLFEQAEVVAPLSFSPDGLVLVGNSGKGLLQWSTADWTSKPLGPDTLQTDTSQFCLLAFTPDSKRLLVSPNRFAREIRILEFDPGELSGTSLAGVHGTTVITTNGRIVAAGDRKGHVSIWDLASGRAIATFKAHDNIVLGMALSPDGRFLATSGNERSIHLWETGSFTNVGYLNGHQNQVWNLKSAGQAIFASASMDHSVRLWSWKHIEQLNENRLAQLAAAGAAGTTEPETAAQATPARDEDADRPPSTHQVAPGASIQAAIDGAAPGDQIELAAGTYEIAEMIVVDKPLTIRGVAGEGEGALPSTVIKEAAGLPYVISIATGVARPTVIRDLQIEAQASGLQHSSGACELRACHVVVRSTLEFKSVVSLEARGHPGTADDLFTFDRCHLRAEYAGDTHESTPPDIDVILAASGSRYAAINITGCEVVNEIPNGIANGLETRSTSARLTVKDSQFRTQGISLVLPNHVGSLDIRDNTIWSATRGIATSIESDGPSYIAGNTLTIDRQHLEVYPLFLQDLIAKTHATCISLGATSAGVTAGFFHKKYIDRGTNILVEGNVFMGNPDVGIALADSPEPENFGPPTPNRSHHNTITRNDFSRLDATHDISLGSSTHDNVIFGNTGAESIFKEAGTNDRNAVSTGPHSSARYTLDEITSPALEGNLLGDPATRGLWVWLPPGYDSSPEERFPTIYLLHGFTGDHHSFKSSTLVDVAVGAQAADLVAAGQMKKAIIVLPDASNAYGGSLFASNKVTGDYLTYIGHDLVAHIDEKYRTLPDRANRAVAGISMGANGAFALAMHYPDTFGAVAAMSPTSDYSATPTMLDTFFAKNPTELEPPTLVRSSDDLRSLFSRNVWVNLLYGRAAAHSPNPDKPPFFVDLPVQYPEKSIVPEVWEKWLEKDLVSLLDQQGQHLADTSIFVDIGIGPTTIMPEKDDIPLLLTALKKRGLAHTFVESPGDHISHLPERTAEVLKFLSAPASYAPPNPVAPE